MEENYKEKLNTIRNNGNAFRNAKKASPISMAKSGAKEIKRMTSLSKQINPFIDWLFGIGLCLALLKDILDLVLVGSLPAIGTVVTLCISFCLGVIMLATGASGNRKIIKSMSKKVLILFSGTSIELFFGLNFLPIETIIIVLSFILTLRDRSIAAEEEKESLKQEIEFAQAA